MEAIADRVLIEQDTKGEWDLNEPFTGIVFSINHPVIKDGDRVVFSKGNHPKQGDYIVVRHEQLYAKIN